jgi:hypothetical protein
MIADNCLPLLDQFLLLARIFVEDSVKRILHMAASESIAMGTEVHVLDCDVKRARRLRARLYS